VLGLGRDFGFGYLGKISFGLYVFHAAALELASNAFVGLVLTIAAAALSYRFLEMPFLRLKQRFARS
jgi:peptidoglycan/LPS O-acetylase OafA/YrhL